MSVTLNELRYFAAVADLGSFTRASESLMISQPSLSRSIAELERSLGVTLLHRTTRSVDMTIEGAEFRQVVRDVLTAYDNGLGRFDAFQRGNRGHVTVAALPSLAAGALPRLLAQFSRTHPDVVVHVTEGVESEVLGRVRDGSADLALSDSGDLGTDLDHHPLDDDPMVAAFAVESPFSAKTTLTWRELAQEPFVNFPVGSSVRRLSDLGFATASVGPLRTLEGAAIGSVAGMVAAGLGVTAIPTTLVPLMNFARLASRALAEPTISRGISLHARLSPSLPPAAREFASLVKQVGIR